MLAENGQIVVDQRDVFARVVRLENLQRGMRLLHGGRELPRAIQHPTLIHEKLAHLQGVGVVGKQHKRLFIHTRGVVLETTLLIHATNVAQKIRLQFRVGGGLDRLFAVGNSVGHFAHQFLGFRKMNQQISRGYFPSVSKWRGDQGARK